CFFTSYLPSSGPQVPAAAVPGIAGSTRVSTRSPKRATIDRAGRLGTLHQFETGGTFPFLAPPRTPGLSGEWLDASEEAPTRRRHLSGGWGLGVLGGGSPTGAAAPPRSVQIDG